MSRRRIDQEKRSPAMDHGQDAIWKTIRERRVFTARDIWGVVEMHYKSIKQYLHRLEKGGYIEQGADFETDYKYKLIKDVGNKAPRLRQDGSPVEQGAGNQQMWNAMRLLPNFRPEDLVAHASIEIKLETAKRYVKSLKQAGYLMIVSPSKTGVRTATYRLVRNTGPNPPKIQRVKQVYDPNLERVTYDPKLVKLERNEDWARTTRGRYE